MPQFAFESGLPYPPGATPITATSASVAAATATATLAAAAGKTTYITGFQVTHNGSTAVSFAALTIVGVITATMNYVVAAGANNAPGSLTVQFHMPVPASAVNTAIVVSCAALGAGNGATTVVAQGYQL